MITLRLGLETRGGSQLATLIYRITHIDNVPWILRNGLHCVSSGIRDPNFVAIGNPDLIEKRASRTVPIPPGGVLDDYIPFYFCTHSVMLYNIHTGYNGLRQVDQREVIYLVSSVERLVNQHVEFVFSDRHAYVENAVYSSDSVDLKQLDWPLIRGRDFRRDPNRPDKIERRAAELLVHQSLPVGAVLGIACHGLDQLAKLERFCEQCGEPRKCRVKRDWYF